MSPFLKIKSRKYFSEIQEMLENKPENVDERNFPKYGWGFIVYSSLDFGVVNKYKEPFYIATKQNLIFNDDIVYVTTEFHKKIYKTLKKYYNRRLELVDEHVK